jgi:hypothetical protein
MLLHIPKPSCTFLQIVESSGSLRIFSSIPSSSPFVLCSIPVFSYELVPRDHSSFCSLVYLFTSYSIDATSASPVTSPNIG